MRVKDIAAELLPLVKEGSGEDTLKLVIEKLEAQQKRFEESKQKKWIVTALVIALVGIITYFAVGIFYDLMKASFDRSEFENLMS